MTELHKVLIFTDLDGTLLNHDDYSFAAAQSYIDKLKTLNIPVIPTTSKTAQELLHFRASADLDWPFIIENGAAIYIPKKHFDQQPKDSKDHEAYWLIENVKPRSYWQALIDKLPTPLRENCFTFADAGLAGVMELTGLEEDAAKLAIQREYGEPFQWRGNDADVNTCLEYLKDFGATVLKGGRFYHVSGNCDKGSALNKLADLYADKHGHVFKTIALGDSGNDIAMLEAADFSAVVHSKHYAPPKINKSEDIYFTQQEAPQGWVEGVNYYLQLQH